MSLWPALLLSLWSSKEEMSDAHILATARMAKVTFDAKLMDRMIPAQAGFERGVEVRLLPDNYGMRSSASVVHTAERQKTLDKATL